MKWLDRNTIVLPHLILCGTERDYLKVVKHLGITDPNAWLTEGFGGKTHTYTQGSKITCVVCIDFNRTIQNEFPDVCGLIIHESVHVWQELCRSIGEFAPSVEFEAYTIQCIASRLIRSYTEQTNVGHKRNNPSRSSGRG